MTTVLSEACVTPELRLFSLRWAQGGAERRLQCQLPKKKKNPQKIKVKDSLVTEDAERFSV